MNLSAYDNITPKIDKTKTWIEPKRKLLLSREIKFRKYFTLSKRYNPKYNITNYYIILLDNKLQDRVCTSTKIDDYGRIKISLNQIWNESGLCDRADNFNISVNHLTKDADGDIYYLDI